MEYKLGLTGKQSKMFTKVRRKSKKWQRKAKSKANKVTPNVKYIEKCNDLFTSKTYIRETNKKRHTDLTSVEH